MKTSSAFVIGLLLAGCSGGGGGGPTGPATGNNPPGGTTGVQSAQVAMRSEDDNYGYGTVAHSFSPGSVTVARGGSVTWNNNTSFAHNVTFSSATGAPLNIVGMTAGSATRTFNTAGAFPYSCTNHEGMAGVVNVQ
jgi:plastocyanin